MHFGVLQTDYIKKKVVLLKTFNTRDNALEFLSDYIKNYILLKQGDTADDNLKTYREPSSLSSNTFNSYPYGYFTCYSTEIFYRSIIYLKQSINGYLFNSTNIQKILSLDLIELFDFYDNTADEIEENFRQPDIEVENYFDDKVLPELILKMQNKIKEE